MTLLGGKFLEGGLYRVCGFLLLVKYQPGYYLVVVIGAVDLWKTGLRPLAGEDRQWIDTEPACSKIPGLVDKIFRLKIHRAFHDRFCG